MRPSEHLRAASIARRYFVAGRTKTEIASEFGISRFKVARILGICLREGIVKIEISVPHPFDLELSDRLRTAYRLRHALVITTPQEPEARLYAELGRAAADLLTELVGEEDVLGFGLGRTLSATVEALEALPPCPVVQLTGVPPGMDPAELVRRVAALSGGLPFPIYAPLVVPDPATVAALLRQPAVHAAASRFGQVTTAALEVDSWEPPGGRLRGVLPVAERAALARRGAVGEFCAMVLSAEGEPLATSLAGRCLAVTREQLRRIPEVLVVAGGRGRSRALRAVLRGRFATSVVTDAGVARALLGPDAG